VYDKTGLLPFATALSKSGVRLLGSGGTAKKIREAGIAIEYATIVYGGYLVIIILQGCL
jgi:AICAR transformylase/IMP cyclohydrolase PurH